jgi:hypothetical protein
MRIPIILAALAILVVITGCGERSAPPDGSATIAPKPAVTIGAILDHIASGRIREAQDLAPNEPALVDFLVTVADPGPAATQRAYDLLQQIRNSGLRTTLADTYGLGARPPPLAVEGATPSLIAVKTAQRRGLNEQTSAYIAVVGEACRLQELIATGRQLLVDGRGKPELLRAAGYANAEAVEAEARGLLHQQRIALGPDLLLRATAVPGEPLPLTVDCSDAQETLSWIESVDSGVHGLRQSVDAAVKRQRAAGTSAIRAVVVP